jgi:GH35 family endo-1,4-beta-xylanase
MNIHLYKYHIISLLLILCLYFNPLLAKVEINHKSWELNGAKDRIEKFRKGKANVHLRLENDLIIPEGTLVKIEMLKHDFKFGVSQTQLWDFSISKEAEKRYFKYHSNLYNYITVGTYWAWHEKKQGEWTFQMRQDENLAFAKKHNITVKGHPLMWHQTFPNWVKNIKNDQDFSNAVDKHIMSVLKNFPEIQEWDTYNEAPAIRKKWVKDREGGIRYLKYNGGLLEGMKHVHDIIESTGTKAKLVANHYEIDDPDFHEMIRYLLDNGNRIDRIGIQTHLMLTEKIKDENWWWDQFERYAIYKTPLQLSEITIPSCPLFENHEEKNKYIEARRELKSLREKGLIYVESTPRMLQFQAEFARDFYTLAFSHPWMSSLVYWSGSDEAAWDGIMGGILDRNMNPKPIYYVLENLIKKEWWTKPYQSKYKDGGINIRGFYGKYKVSLTLDGVLYKGIYNMPERERQTLELVLKE